MSKMTREEFKRRWMSDEDGGGLTWDDVADCAVAWGLVENPRIWPQGRVLDMVLFAAGVPKEER